MSPPVTPVGIVVAGGRGRRLGGAKATVELAGRPLIAYPLAALGEALEEVAVVAKADTPLPALGGVPVWREADEPTHPLVGIVTALRRAGGRPVLVCAVDLPLVTPALLRRLAGTAGASGGGAVIATGAGGPQPLLGRYEPSALAALEAALAAAPLPPLRAAVAALGPELLAVADEAELLNVNDADDLARAAAHLRAQPNVKS